MQLQRTYKKEIFYTLVLFFTLISIVISVLYNQYNQRKIRAEQRMLATEYDFVRSSALTLRLLAKNTYNIKINNQEITKLLFDASKTPKRHKEIRKELYQKLLPVYRELENYNIKQFQFFLPNGISFLRFNAPKKYKDNVKQIRYGIELVEKTHKYVYGFEEGKMTNGYRNIYPLFYQNHFVGIVEISYSINAITQILTHIKKANYALLVKKSLIKQVVWKEYQSNYVPSYLNNRYLIDQDILSTLLAKNYKFSKEDFKKLEKKIQKKIKPLLDKKDQILLPVSVLNENYVLMFFRIKDIKGNIAAYLISMEQNSFFPKLKATFFSLVSILIFLTISTSLLFFLFLKKQYDFNFSLQQQSFIDPLTSLLNRRGFNTYAHPLLSILKREKKPYSILFLDIDFFKKVNDTYGHDVGDKVLQELAQILLNFFRNSDLVARWGGEEFIVMLHECSKNQAVEKAEILRKKIEAFKKKDLPQFTISIGVKEGSYLNSINDSIQAADELLYTAKENGRNRIESA